MRRVAELFGECRVALRACDDERDIVQMLDRGERRGLVLACLHSAHLKNEVAVQTELGEARRRSRLDRGRADPQRHDADALRRHAVGVDEVLLRRLRDSDQDAGPRHGPARAEPEISPVGEAVRVRVPLEREVMDHREHLPCVRKRNHVSRHEEQVRTLPGEPDRKPHLRPHAPKGEHQHIHAQSGLGPGGEETPAELGCGLGEPGANLASEDFGARGDRAGRGVDVDGNHRRPARGCHVSNDLKLTAVGHVTGRVAMVSALRRSKR